jgi:uncharacterized protein YdhG (YjbR/CyaY superfamily)
MQMLLKGAFSAPLIQCSTSDHGDGVDEKTGYTSVDDYVSSFPEDVQKKLIQLRKLIAREAPDAEEKISYQMPAFFLNGVVVWYAAYSKHIGFYPKASAIVKFKRELLKYKTAKGSVQFPLDEPLPVELIRRIVRYRVGENVKKKNSR